MKELTQVAVVGLGLLGGLISLAVLRFFTHTKVVGYTYRCSARDAARQLAVASERQAGDAD